MDKPSPTASKDQLTEYFKNSYLKENSAVDIKGQLAELGHEHAETANYWKDIVFSLIKTGEYAMHIEENGTWLVYPSPNYMLNESVKTTNDSVKRTNSWMIFLTIAIVGISLTALIAQLRSKEGIDIETQRILREHTQELRNIQLSLERINASMNRIVLDTSRR
jgi:hypothetical protein